MFKANKSASSCLKMLPHFYFSVSGPSATIYAYLGEFHTIKHRSRVIMYASVIFGLTCISLPLMAWLVINQQWQFYIPVIDVVFKPWRLFLIVCGLPSFVCALALIKVPESPRFDLSQGRQSETIATLQFIHRINKGKRTEPLNIDGILEDVEVVSMKTKDVNANRSKIGRILHSMKVQTLPLFMAPHLKKTLIACAIQFGIFTSSNGMYMFFPLILNRMADFTARNPQSRATICEILTATKINVTDVLARNNTVSVHLFPTNITFVQNCDFFPDLSLTKSHFCNSLIVQQNLMYPHMSIVLSLNYFTQSDLH